MGEETPRESIEVSSTCLPYNFQLRYLFFCPEEEEVCGLSHPENENFASCHLVFIVCFSLFILFILIVFQWQSKNRGEPNGAPYYFLGGRRRDGFQLESRILREIA